MKIKLLIFCTWFIASILPIPLTAEEAKQTAKQEKKKAVYKSVDQYGNITFTDEPSDNAETIEIKELPTVNFSPLPVNTPGTINTEPAATGYKSFAIIAPKPEETFRNVETVNTTTQVQPPLQKNHRLKVMLDGKILPGQGLSRTISNVERGAHTLSAQIEDTNGKLVQTATPVQFFMQRTSVLLSPARAK